MSNRTMAVIRHRMDSTEFWHGFLAGTVCTLTVSLLSIWAFSSMLGAL